MASTQAVFKRFGLSLTHNRLRVRKMKDLVKFYTEQFGMKQTSSGINESTNEEIVHLGFSGSDGEKANQKVTFFELVSPQSQENLKGEVVNCGRGDIYWKIGVCMPDLDKAAKKLELWGVTEPQQFRDIGYLCHMQDPDGYSIELLQFYFKGNKQKYDELPEHPLGQETTFGMVTLRVKDIDASLKFYCDTLGMKLLCKEDVSVYGFYLYFIAFTDEKPPNDDVSAEENREWTYQRPYTVLELQNYTKPMPDLKFNDVGPEKFGFLGLGMGTSGLEGLRSHLEASNKYPSGINTDSVMGTQCFTVKDPDGIPIRFAQF